MSFIQPKFTFSTLSIDPVICDPTTLLANVSSKVQGIDVLFAVIYGCQVF